MNDEHERMEPTDDDISRDELIILAAFSIAVVRLVAWLLWR